MAMLSIQDISKKFGTNKIIDGLSLEVPDHSIYGFIGQNGAGKTTTMKMILGLYTIDSGEIYVNDKKVTYGQNETNKFIGYLPDVPEFYGYMKPSEYLNLCGEITKIPTSKRKEKIGELLELVGLSTKDKRIQGFSRGMKQRLGIAQALLNEPKLLICDEPTSALDPVGRKEILDILLSVKDHTTIIFSTHILSDVERVCDEVGVLHNGKLALKGTMEEIRNIHGSDGFEVEFHDTESIDRFEETYAKGERLADNLLYYKGRKEEDMMAAIQVIMDNNLRLKKVEMREPTLESLFMEVIGR